MNICVTTPSVLRMAFSGKSSIDMLLPRLLRHGRQHFSTCGSSLAQGQQVAVAQALGNSAEPHGGC